MSVTLADALRMVEAFHHHVRVSPKEDPNSWSDGEPSRLLRDVGAEVQRQGGRLTAILDSRRGLRGHLCVEEPGELLEAMANGDPVATLDALADMLYVLLGTAVTFELPLEEALVEVHRSNMTKEKQPDDPHAERVRSKGPNYEPPRLREVYWLHRRIRHGDSREVVAAAIGVDPEVIKQFEYTLAYEDNGTVLSAYDRAVNLVKNRNTSRT